MKKILILFLNLSMLLSCIYPCAHAAEPDKSNAFEAVSPDGTVSFEIILENGCLYFSVKKKSAANGGAYFETVTKSPLGIKCELGDFKDSFTFKEKSEYSQNSSWTPLVGEQELISDSFNAVKAVFTHQSGYDLTIEVRAYNEGAAFRYILPDSDKPYNVYSEYTKINLNSETDGFAAAHVEQNQTIPSKISISDLGGKTYQRPMTVCFDESCIMTIAEANVDNYSIFALYGNSGSSLDVVYPKALKAKNGKDSPSYNTVTSSAATPWRVFVLGNTETDLPKNASIIQNLNEPADEEKYKFSEWVQPGSCLRAVTGMNTKAICGVIDQAASCGFKYVLLDTSWYGPEFDVNCDPRLDPAALDPNNENDKILLDNYFGKSGEGKYGTGEGIFKTFSHGFDVYKTLKDTGNTMVDVDIPKICDYANANNIGIILYVNGVYFPDSSGRNRFDADTLFSYFEKWGVKGVKPGFVACRTQEFEKNMQTVIEAAAKHKLVVTIHDEYVISGTERTFPNVFCTEGILGDEGIGRYDKQTQTEYDIATLFTRTIQSPADHTFCYPGKGTKAYALASPIMFRSGMSMLYWYTTPANIPYVDRNMLKIWNNFPGTWKQSLFLEGKMYEYATYARESFNGDWYIGSLTHSPRSLKIPLTFLASDTKYLAQIYRDGSDANADTGWNSAEKGNQTLLINSYIVDKSTVLENELKASGGYAVKLTKASSAEILSYEAYSKELADSQTESTKNIQVRIDLKYVDFNDTVPFIENGRTLVPFRAVFEALGANVTWDDKTFSATAVKDDITIKITKDSKMSYVNDSGCELDVPAEIIADRFYVPLRFISESFGYTVHWDDSIKTAIIRSVKKNTDLSSDQIEIKSCFYNGYYDGNDEIGEFSYDGDTSTVWSCEGEGKFVTYDLGEKQYIEKAAIMWNKGGQRKSLFKILISDDNKNFTEIFDGESSGTSENEFEEVPIKQNARYIKILCNGNSTGKWNAIKEIQFFKK